jgi:hypothetical protein
MGFAFLSFVQSEPFGGHLGVLPQADFDQTQRNPTLPVTDSGQPALPPAWPL